MEARATISETRDLTPCSMLRLICSTNRSAVPESNLTVSPPSIVIVTLAVLSRPRESVHLVKTIRELDPSSGRGRVDRRYWLEEENLYPAEERSSISISPI